MLVQFGEALAEEAAGMVAITLLAADGMDRKPENQSHQNILERLHHLLVKII